MTREKAQEVILKAGSPVEIPPQELEFSLASLDLVKSPQGYQYDKLQNKLAKIYKQVGFMEEYNYQSKSYVRLTEKGKKSVFELPDTRRMAGYFGFSDLEFVQWKAQYANANFKKVSGISLDSDSSATIEVEFFWERNELGRLIQDVEKKEKNVSGVMFLPSQVLSVGKMRRYDDGWRLESLKSLFSSSTGSVQ